MNLETVFIATVRRDDVVGIATRYGLDGPGIKYRWGEVLRTQLDRPWDPPSLLCSGHRVNVPAVNGRGVALATHPHLAPRLKKEYPSLGLHCTFWVNFINCGQKTPPQKCPQIRIPFPFRCARILTARYRLWL
jgi:hypothetical protein